MHKFEKNKKKTFFNPSLFGTALPQRHAARGTDHLRGGFPAVPVHQRPTRHALTYNISILNVILRLFGHIELHSIHEHVIYNQTFFSYIIILFIIFLYFD